MAVVRSRGASSLLDLRSHLSAGVVRDVWTIDAAGGAPRRLTDGPVSNGLPVWSPDSRWLYYPRFEADGVDIWRIPADGGTPERVTNHAGRGADVRVDRLRFSPDGRVLYYKQADGEAPLVAHPLDGGVERVVIDCVAGRGYDVGPRGIYYIGCATADREQPFYRFDPTTGRREPLGKDDVGSDHWIAVSLAGGPILFTKYIPNFDLMMIENFR